MILCTGCGRKRNSCIIAMLLIYSYCAGTKEKIFIFIPFSYSSYFFVFFCFVFFFVFLLTCWKQNSVLIWRRCQWHHKQRRSSCCFFWGGCCCCFLFSYLFIFMLPFFPRHTLINHDVINVYVCVFCQILRCCKCVYFVRHRDVLLCILCLGDIGSLPHVSIHMYLINDGLFSCAESTRNHQHNNKIGYGLGLRPFNTSTFQFSDISVQQYASTPTCQYYHNPVPRSASQ